MHCPRPTVRSPLPAPPRSTGLRPATWRCTWIAGPDAGATHSIALGRHVLGRAAVAGVRCDDPDLQPHHALLEVPLDGALWLTQLTGRHPILVDGRPIQGATAVPDGSWIELGASVMHCTADVPGEPAQPAQLRDHCLVRCPRAVPAWSPAQLTNPGAHPERGEGPGGLLPAALGVAGAGVAAALLHQPLFFVFGALGGLVAVASWVAQHLAIRRRWRGEIAVHRAATSARAAELAADRERFRRYHLATVPTITSARRTITDRSIALWSRRREHHDAFTVSLGLGEQVWRTDDEVAGGVLSVPRLPIPADLGPGARVAVRGRRAPAVARAVLAQLVAGCGPADLRIVIVTDRADRWSWVRGLPHATMPDGATTVVDDRSLATTLLDLEGEPRPHVVLVTDLPGVLATRTNPVRRALADASLALLAVLPVDVEVPHVCQSVLTITGDGRGGRWVADARTTMLPVPVVVAGLGERSAAGLVSALRPLADPEDPLCGGRGLPTTVALAALLTTAGSEAITPAGIAARWTAAPTDPSPRTVIGLAAEGVVDIDLVRDGPHGLIAGTTGSGKSELLRSLIAGMAVTTGPTQLNIVLIDYKGGATFDACALLPHVVGVVTDLDGELADRVLRSLDAELRRRESLLREHGAGDLAALRHSDARSRLPRLLVVVDEFAALVAEQPTFLHALVDIAQRGRSLGVHLLLATQRPSGVISDDIRANANLRLALRLQDAVDAIDVVGDRAPALLPRRLPGRAVMRLGADEHVTFQIATSAGDLEPLVRAIDAAARLAGLPAPHPPWQPPLARDLAAASVPGGAIGLVDDPDHQRIEPLHWCPDNGHVLVVGSRGSGVTSTLLTLARHGAQVAHLYVLDACADERWSAMASVPSCGAVVRLHERERLMRLLHHLRLEVRGRTEARGRRRTGSDVEAPLVVVIDGLDVVRRTLDDLDTAAEFDALEEVLAAAAAAGITIIAGAEQVAAVPASFSARCAHRWVAHLHDAHDAMALGVAAGQVPNAIPGRIVIATTGLHAQVVRPGAAIDDRTPSATARLGRPAAIECVPSVVSDRDLPAGRRGDRALVLPVGADFATGSPHLLEVPDREHVLVVGPARSGRTTTLLRLASGWREAHPDGWVGVLAPRCSPRHLETGAVHADAASLVAELPVSGPTLLVVDDAELVEDSSGQLASIVAGRDGTLVLAAGRPDALRQRYGHWTGVVRRSRLGFVSACGTDLDGDLLGAVLARRLPIAPRPGLAWSVANGEARLVQVAVGDQQAARAC